MTLLAFFGFFLALVSLYAEQSVVVLPLEVLSNVSELILYVFIIIEVFSRLASVRWRPMFFHVHRMPLITAAVFVVLFPVLKLLPLDVLGVDGARLLVGALAVREVVVFVAAVRRSRGWSTFVERFRLHPAQTTLLSFLVVIFAGTALLLMPFSTTSGRGLDLIDAFFTATSAVCVTGLSTIDVSTTLSIWGRVVLLALIQIGGLGIMILTFFSAFALRRRFSVENKLLVSYVLSESDMSRLRTTVFRIFRITFGIELCGTALLYVRLHDATTGFWAGAFSALFHSVSAFCNAGFSLFHDSLVSYAGDPLVSLTIALLIILGGLSFTVIGDVYDALAARVQRLLGRRVTHNERVGVNTKVVLWVSGVLIVVAFLAIYALEHGNALQGRPIGTQYLASFFQAVTLRTAGFNSIPFDALRAPTYAIFLFFMFVGAASGSTGGGIKVGTVAVLWSYFRAAISARNVPTLFRHSLLPVQVQRAVAVLLFGLSAIAVGTVLIMLVSGTRFTMLQVLFESTSAFATVGLSTGITAGLPGAAKIIVCLLMYVGRVGTLTLLGAVGASSDPKVRVAYPTAGISVG